MIAFLLDTFPSRQTADDILKRDFNMAIKNKLDANDRLNDWLRAISSYTKIAEDKFYIPNGNELETTMEHVFSPGFVLKHICYTISVKGKEETYPLVKVFVFEMDMAAENVMDYIREGGAQ